jgi:hypothetical protein
VGCLKTRIWAPTRRKRRRGSGNRRHEYGCSLRRACCQANGLAYASTLGWMRVEPQQRNAHPREDRGGSMNLPTSVAERVNQGWMASQAQFDIRLRRKTTDRREFNNSKFAKLERAWQDALFRGYSLNRRRFLGYPGTSTTVVGTSAPSLEHLSCGGPAGMRGRIR